MVYRWNVDGASLEFPTPYAVENRFLTLRGYALIALSLLVSLMLAFVDDGYAARPVVVLEELPEPASAVPHVLAAMLMAIAGVLNLWQASRQRALQMVPGQPASLMSEVAHEATGASPGAPWLMQALGRGVATAALPGSPYARLLRRLGNDMATAPSTLHAYMRVRLAHLLLLGALALLLAGAMGAATPAPQARGAGAGVGRCVAAGCGRGGVPLAAAASVCTVATGRRPAAGAGLCGGCAAGLVCCRLAGRWHLAPPGAARWRGDVADLGSCV